MYHFGSLTPTPMSPQQMRKQLSKIQCCAATNWTVGPNPYSKKIFNYYQLILWKFFN